MPAYYERALTKKYVYEEKARDMIKIIEKNVTVDAASLYDLGFDADTLRPVYENPDLLEELLSDDAVLGKNSILDQKIAALNLKYASMVTRA